MNWIDYIIISIIMISMLTSLVKGFIRELLSLMTLWFSFYITNHYYDTFEKFLIKFHNKVISDVISIIVLFIITMIVGSIISNIIISLLKKTKISKIDRILGLCFGMLRGLLIVTIIIFFISKFALFFGINDWKQSKLVPQFNHVIEWISSYIK